MLNALKKEHLIGFCATVLMWSMVSVVSILTPIGTAQAHGERNQEPFLRMRTVHWFDIKFSRPANEVIKVNELLTITGKFRLFGYWPDQLPEPKKIYLNAVSAGSVFTKVESWVNEKSAVQSFKGELGRDYEFKLVLKARWEGTWHIHPMLNILDAGGLVGPGVWYNVGGSYTDYKQSVTTVSGLEIDDVSKYSVDRIYGWHILWLVIGIIWIIWWIRRPLLMPRYLMTKQGDYEDVLVTKTDRVVSGLGIVVVLAIVITSMLMATKEFPRTITLQAGLAVIPPIDEIKAVKVDMQSGQYYIPGRTVIANIKVTNNQDKPIRLGEFTSSNLRFLDRTVVGVDDGKANNSPQDLIAGDPLVISNNEPLMPGDSRVIRIEATDAAWEVERLSSLLNDPESTLGALLFFYDDRGTRYISELYGNMVPVYTDPNIHK